MADIRFGEAVYACEDSETVLECLERNGESVPSSCRSGVCHSCLMRATKGDPGPNAKRALKETMQEQNYFLSCVCRPGGDMTVALPDMAGLSAQGRLIEKAFLNHRTVRLRYATDEAVDYRAGQFMNLTGPGGAIRSYSLASVPDLDGYLEFHIMVLPGGVFSGWAFNEAEVGDETAMLGPQGSCFYVSGRDEQPLLLAGTGTGLAPLYAIARDALAQRHRGPIRLYHGGVAGRDLYLVDELRDLERTFGNFSYHPCVLDDSDAGEGVAGGDITAYALDQDGGLGGWRVFLCGDTQLVRAMQRAAFKAGAALKDIHADAFLPSGGA